MKRVWYITSAITFLLMCLFGMTSCCASSPYGSCCGGTLKVSLVNYDLSEIHFVYFNVYDAGAGQDESAVASGAFAAGLGGDAEPAYAMYGGDIYVFIGSCYHTFDVHIFIDRDDSYGYSDSDMEYWEYDVEIHDSPTLLEADYNNFDTVVSLEL